MSLLLIALSGLVVGAMGTFFGVGGGIIVIPILTQLFKYSIHEAVGTSLLIVLSTSIITTEKNIRAGRANIQVGLIIAVSSLLGSIAGGNLSMYFEGRILYFVLGSVQILSAVIMAIKEKLPEFHTGKVYMHCSFVDNGVTQVYNVYNLKLVQLLAFMNGMLAGMVGVGGGVIIVPVMNLIAGIPIKVATATSALIMGFTAVGSGSLFFLEGYTRVDVVAALVPSIYISSLVCSRIVSRVNSQKLYKAFIVLLVLVALQMFYSGLK